eukprot:CAMPEP_0173091042 /NCGR_PEP_ID=MMETSP1102-20130122/27539_1 /TAXON_ID=49646 /ORGANISM="Geminigera sp., Strain Caron Lab Isolate" /LENGTH=71 /DNA_ID=CAMNT_0013976551 /DNA_START=199 /DNA_END=412 /DNA_ORIENTATION=-
MTYSQSLPLSTAAGVLPCCRCDLLCLPPPAAKAVGAALPSRACVPMAKEGRASAADRGSARHVSPAAGVGR